MRLGYAAWTVGMVIAFAVMVATRQGTQPIDVYIAFTCGVTIWGWQMAGYYLGYVTGPSPERGHGEALPAGAASQYLS